MTEIQETIANLQGKVKKEVEELAKAKQLVACLESQIDNNMTELKKIIDIMEVK